ncbi:MAG: DAK2 domain-containing protein [Coriobacteriia bacterium]|nr:DAK2 domain-containing protein [Coriobacteriia bacterium]
MTSNDYIRYIISAAQALFDRKEEVNRLNVFPVPDGDTGTNMSLTLETVIQELIALGDSPSFSEIRKAITHGSLMGARGNSGVITSQILRGLCEGIAQVEDDPSLDTPYIISALNRAVEVAFSAVRKPVEGTILTVLRDVRDAAVQAADSGLDYRSSLLMISDEAFASVRRTPELLPVLKENNVVDAGGFGLAILVKGYVDAVMGFATVIPQADMLTQAAPKVSIEQINDWDDSEFLYCTEFLLLSDAIDVDDTLTFLSSLGDCELLVGSCPNYKVHVHTNDPGAVLSYMTERGQVSEVHIHNMKIQTGQRSDQLRTESTNQGASKSASQPPKPIGIVAVCAGEGTRKILESAGVDLVVHGGQTMNPSTKDFVDAIAAINAEQIIIFPNNKNIILAATAATEIADKKAFVVPTISVPQSFAALFVIDLSEGVERNLELINETIKHVKCGEITTAIKDAKAADGSSIKKGDVIGIANGSIDVIGSNLTEVALELIGIIAQDADILTILAGEDLDQESFDDLIASIEEAYPDLEIDAQRGEQPLYPIVMAAE